MGAATVAVLNTKINADPGGLIRGFGQAQKHATDFGSKIKDVQAKLAATPATNLFEGAVSGASKLVGVLGKITPALGAIGVGLSFAGIASGVEAIDNLSKTADGLGTTLANLQELRHAAESAGSGAESLDVGVSRLVRNLGEINAGGAQEAAATLQRLRLDPRQLGAMDASEAFKQVAISIGELPTAADKASAATRIFGREAMQLAPLFELNKKQWNELGQEAKGYGVALNAIDAAKLKQTADTFDSLKAAATGAKNKLLVELAPAIIATNQFLSGTVAVIKDVDSGWIKAGIQAATFTTVLGSSIKVATFAIGAYNKLAEATRNVSKAQSIATAIAQGLSGPKGWLSLGVGALAAAGASYAISGALDRASIKLKATAIETAAATEEAAKLKKEMAKLDDVMESATGNAAANAKSLGDVFRDLVRKSEEATAATFDKLMERGNALTLELRTPEMKFADDVRELQQLRDMGAITGDVFDRAFSNANEQLRDALRNLSGTKNAISDIGAGVKGTAGGFAALYGGVEETNRRMQEAQKIEEQVAAAKAKVEATPFKPLVLAEWKIDPKSFGPDAVSKADAMFGNLRGGFEGRANNEPSLIGEAIRGVKFPQLEAKPLPQLEAKPIPAVEVKPPSWLDPFTDFFRKPVTPDEMAKRMAEQKPKDDAKMLQEMQQQMREMQKQTGELQQIKQKKTIVVKKVKL